MCPYYDKDRDICKIYKTTQNSYNKAAYCLEGTYSFVDCPNYKQLCKVYNGFPPPPYKY